jgi:hypothetical protein
MPTFGTPSRECRGAAGLLAALTLVLLGCPPPREKPKGGGTSPPAEALLPPRVDDAFLRAAFGAGFRLAGDVLIRDLDPRPGQEAIFAITKGGHFELVVVRGDRQVLARAPLAGKVLGQADITLVGKLQALDLLPTGPLITSPTAYLLPIETLVYQRSVCGILAFRYRRDALVLVGEFSCKCWRKEAGGEGGDPISFMKVTGEGANIRVEMQEDQGETGVHRWDASLGAFISQSAGKAGAKQR